MKIKYLIISFVLLLSGCEIGSVNPLSNITNSIVDDRLSGSWEGEGERIHFIKNRSKSMYLLIEDRKPKLFEVFATIINNENYFSMRGMIVNDCENSKNITDELYYFFKYTFDNTGKLLIWELDESSFTDAINKGLLKSKKIDNDIILTDTTANIVDYIKNNKIDLTKKHEFIKK